MNYERKQKNYYRFTLLTIFCCLSFASLLAQCIDQVVVEAHPCDPNNQFLVDIDFNFTNDVSDSFSIVGNGNNYGNFAYSDLYLTLGPLEGNGMIYEFIITDLENSDCTAIGVLESPNCAPPTDCNITNFYALAMECNPDGTFSVNLGFDYENPNNDFFDLIDASGNIIGTYLLSSLPLTLPSFTPSGNVYEYLQVCINDNSNCCAETEFNTIECPVPDCFIDNATFDYSECDPNNLYEITLNFEHDATSDSFNVVNTSGDNVGTFAYTDLPVSLGFYFPETNIFTITDSENENCFFESWSIHSCLNNCEIIEVTTTHLCNNDNTFNFYVAIQSSNTSDSFELLLNQVSYGNFAYADGVIQLLNLPSSGVQSINTTVVDSQYPNCTGESGNYNAFCPPNCEITNFSALALECNPDGTFSVEISFDYENPNNDFFDLIDAGGNIIGTYLLSSLPLTIPSFTPSGNVYEYLQVCINDNSNCCAETEFNTIECPTNNCELWNLVVEADDCDADGNFLVDIDFDFANTSDSFSVVGNGMNYGNFAYSDLFITLGPLVGDETLYEFIITDLENSDCVIIGEFQSQNCAPVDCEIFDLVVETGDCNPDGTYPLWLNFLTQNPTNDFFDLFNANGNLIGTYTIADLPIEISYGPSSGAFDALSVCINDNPDCCASIEFPTPDCGTNNCELWNLVVEAYDCDADGNFLVDIDFDFANTSDSFSVVGNGMNYGNFAYSDLFITLGPLVGDETLYEFIITDLENSDCVIIGEFQSQNCAPVDCEIFDLVVETGDCNPDGTYPLWLNFLTQNPTNDFFDLFNANGNLIETYTIADLPIEISYGPSSGAFDALSVCINDNPDCCASIEFPTPDCGMNNCELWNIVVEAYDCDADGNFLVDIDFDFANTSDSFFVLGNGNNYGIFAYSDLYITIGPLEGDGATNYNFIIMDQDHPDCVAAYNLGVIDCNTSTDCSISNLEVYPLDCNPDGSYNLVLLFDYLNVNTNGFDVYSGNTFVGYYDYTVNFPITINSFPASGNINDVITVCDSGGEVCCGTLEFEAPSCVDCEIYDMLVQPFPCNDNDQFFVSLDFENVGGGSLGFLAFGNGTNYGNFDYDDLPITLGPFNGDGNTVYEFIVVDITNNDCIGFVELSPIDCIVPPPVWPGDANFNNIANNIDLLNLGLAFGLSGEARPETSIEWFAWEAENWPTDFDGGINYKHADCNGDGVVDLADIQAIEMNYNETHGPVAPFEETPSTPDDPPLYVDLPPVSDVTIGEVFVAPIILGSLDNPVEEIYGLAFTIEFDPDMMDEAGVYVETNSSWLGDPATELISIDKNFPNDGKIDVAITRTDQTNVDGFGQISYFIGIIDDVAGKSELEITITNVRAITAHEIWIPLITPPSIIDFATDVETITKADIEVFPNPSSDRFFVRNLSSENIERISVYNVLGQLSMTKEMPSNYEQIDVSNWPSGIYFMELLMDGKPILKQLEVIHQ